VVLRERSHKVGGLAFLSGVRIEDSIPQLDQSAAVGADPQAAIARGQQAKDAVLSKGRRILMRKEPEARSVKTQQPATGSHPEITVGCLGKGLYRLLRQTILRLPGADRVVPLLVDCGGSCDGRLLRLRASAGQQERADESQQKSPRDRRAFGSSSLPMRKPANRMLASLHAKASRRRLICAQPAPVRQLSSLIMDGLNNPSLRSAK